MKITTAWAEDDVGGSFPWLVSSYDEYTADGWGGVPDFFTDAVRRAGPDAEGNGPRVRILEIEIPEDAVRKLFEAPVVKGELPTDAPADS